MAKKAALKATVKCRLNRKGKCGPNLIVRLGSSPVFETARGKLELQSRPLTRAETAEVRRAHAAWRKKWKPGS